MNSIISQWEGVLKRYIMVKVDSRFLGSTMVQMSIPHKVVIISIKIRKGNS